MSNLSITVSRYLKSLQIEKEVGHIGQNQNFLAVAGGEVEFIHCYRASSYKLNKRGMHL